MTGILSFNHDDLFLRKLLLFLLGDVQAQHAMLQLCADVRFGERIPHIEAPLHRTSPALLTDDLALLRGFVLIQALSSRHDQVAVLQLQRDVFRFGSGI